MNAALSLESVRFAPGAKSPPVAPERPRARETAAAPEAPPSPGAAPAAPTRKKRTGLWIGLAAALLLGAGGTWYAHYAGGFEETDDAYIDAHVRAHSSRVAGTVSAVLIDDNQFVQAGQPLVKLDPADFDVLLQEARTDLAQAEAALPQAEAQLAQAQAQAAQSDAQIQQSDAQLEKAALDFQRAGELLRKNVSAKSEFDAAKAAYDVAQANGQALRSQRQAALSNAKAAEAAIGVARAKARSAEARVRDAELQLSYTTIPAAATGRVGKRTVEVGQRLQAGEPLLAVVGADFWITANFKENQLTQMKDGQRVKITVDAIKGHEFTGRVDSFSPGTGAKFALLPPDNATGNFTKVVQRVPVKIVFDKESVRGFENRINPGLSAVVKVLLRDDAR